MKVIRCSACGHCVYKEFPRCPACGKKSLVFQHSYESSGAAYNQIMRSRETAAGSNPVISLGVVTLLVTGLSYLLFTWMFPSQPLTQLSAPKAIASATK